MKTPKHTKTPWMIAYGGEEGDGYAVIASKFSDRPVCTIEPRDFNTANAALIVRAVNAHELLVEALEAFQRSEVSAHVESYVKWCRESGPASHVETAERERIARAAYLAGWCAMRSSIARQAEDALRAAKGEA